MLVRIEIIVRKLNMTQCEEIKKKLQKVLPVHTLDEKRLEHLPQVELKLYTFDGKRPIDFAKKYKRKYLSSWIREHM